MASARHGGLGEGARLPQHLASVLAKL